MDEVMKMHVVLSALNAKYIHKNLALRWLYVSRPASFDVHIVEGVIRDDPMNTAQRILAYRPDVVGLSVYIFNAEETKALIACLLTLMPDVRIILGGPEVTYHPRPWLELGVEAVVCGEGETVFWDYLQGKPSPSIHTLQEASSEIARIDLGMLETLESPYFLELDEADMDKRYLYMETARGCPFDCAYCLSSLEKGMRRFSDAYLDRTFDRLADSGVKQVKFLDRTFNVDPVRALQIARRLTQLPSSISFHVELVGDTLGPEIIGFFTSQAKSRFRVEIGVQSFNRKTLLEVGRYSRLDLLKNVILQFSEAGVHQHTDLIAGLPYEDIHSFKQSFNTLFSLNPFEIQVGILKLLHGTRLRRDHEKYGYTFIDRAPYPITSSSWMSEEDMKSVESVANAVEKLYNSQKLRATMQVWVDEEGLDAFELFRKVGEGLRELKRPYSQRDFFQCIANALKDDVADPMIRLKSDYYRLSPIFPQPFWEEGELDDKGKEVRKEIRNRLDASKIRAKHMKIVERADGKDGSDVWVYPALGKSHTVLRFDEKYNLESETVYESAHRDA